MEKNESGPDSEESLSLAINYGLFQFEVINNTEKAIEIGEDALN